MSDKEINLSSLNGGESYNHHFNHKAINKKQRKMEREERQNIVLWKRPLITMQYFFLELIITVKEYWRRYKINNICCVLHRQC